MKEAKDFIFKKLNECCLFIHDDYPKSIFHIYDKQAIRIKKLQRLSNKTDLIDFNPTKNSYILFEQDYKNSYFWYSYNKIYQTLIFKYCLNDIKIHELIKNILKDDNKMKYLIPLTIEGQNWKEFKIYNKIKSLTPKEGAINLATVLKKNNKIKSLKYN